MTHTMRELLELRLAGKPLPPHDERNARRVYCPACLDDGVLRVWHPKTVDEARALLAADKPLTELQTHYDAVAACTCRAGDSWCNRDVKGGGTRAVLPRYGEQALCRLAISTKNADDHATLEAWLANWRPANYERSFDSFNSGEMYREQEFEFAP